jgi:hypothetical protein
LGTGWLRPLLTYHGVQVEVLHPKAASGMKELLEDYMSPVAIFDGRMHGIPGMSLPASVCWLGAQERTDG